MNNFFALLAQCLQALAEEWGLDLAAIHEIESYPDILQEGWWMHLNGEMFAHVKLLRGKPDIRFSAYYSDYDYLLNPQAEVRCE